MFRILGLLAAIDLRLNWIRFYFVPLNLAVVGLLLWGVATGLTRIAEGPSDALAQTVTVADLAAGRVAAGSFVRVSGFVQPGLVLELGKKGSGGKLESVHDRLRLLHDSGKPAVWLRRESELAEVEGRPTFVGLVQPLPEAARKATASEGGTIDGRVPSMGYLLEEGGQPRSFVSGVAHLVICAPPLALLAWVWIRRSVIFRPGLRGATAEGSANELIDVRVSGRLRFDGRAARRFVETGAELRRQEDGGIAIEAYLDASSYVMGICAVDRAGLWTSSIPAGAALSIVVGEMAFGTGVRPAARLEVRVGGRVVERLTLSFGSRWQGDRVLRMLCTTFAAHQATAAA